MLTSQWVPLDTGTASAPNGALAIPLIRTVVAQAILPNTCSPSSHVTEALAAHVISSVASKSGHPLSKNALEQDIQSYIALHGKTIPIYEHNEPLALKDALPFAEKSPILKCPHIKFTFNSKDSEEKGYIIFIRHKTSHTVIGALHYSKPSENPDAYDMQFSICHIYGSVHPNLSEFAKRYQKIFQGKDPEFELYYPTTATAASTAAAASASTTTAAAPAKK